ncbi:hypothetical protein J7L48_08865 [bacterium]|nr:hypothetical protein [bacterium]
MKERKNLFFILLGLFLILIAGCIGKSTRTFGPITLSISSSQEPIIQGNSVTLTASMGYDNYSWEITSTNPYNCTFKKTGADRAFLITTYQNAVETYPMSFKITDSKGNIGERKFIITKAPVELNHYTHSYSYNYFDDEVQAWSTTDHIYIYVSPQLMPDFDHWFIESGPGIITNIHSNETTFYSNGNGSYGLTTIYAIGANGNRSLKAGIKVTTSQSYPSTAIYDGHIERNISAGTYTRVIDLAYGQISVDSTYIRRAFYSFHIPSSIHIMSSYLYYSKQAVSPTTSFDNDTTYMKYIGKNIWSSGSYTDHQIFDSLNGTPPSNAAFFPCSNSINTGMWNYVYFDNTFIIDVIQSCTGSYFDIGFRWGVENTSQAAKSCSISTGETASYRPYLSIKYY